MFYHLLSPCEEYSDVVVPVECVEENEKKTEDIRFFLFCVNTKHDEMSQCPQTSIGNQRTKKILPCENLYR